jgi:hypothetical protein
MRIRRTRIQADPARGDDGGQRWLQRVGRDIGCALQQRRVSVDRRRGRVLERGHTRFVPSKRYLARDSIKYLRGLGSARSRVGSDAPDAGDGGQAKGSFGEL